MAILGIVLGWVESLTMGKKRGREEEEEKKQEKSILCLILRY